MIRFLSFLLFLSILFISACSSKETSTENKKILFPVKTGELWGFADTNCAFVVPPVYSSIGQFYESLALVTKNGQTYFMNDSGKLMNTKGYLQGTHFCEGMAFVMDADSQFICISNSMKELFILDPVIDRVETYSSGLAAVCKNGKYGFMDKNGKVVIDFIFDAVSSFSEDVAAVAITIDSVLSWKYIDKSGNPVSAKTYADALPFHQGRAAVHLGDTWNWINKSGEVMINADFDECRSFYNGFAAFRKGENWGILSISGKEVLEPSYPMIGNCSEGRFVFTLGPGASGYLDTTGKIVVQPAYKAVSDFKNGIAYVVSGSRIGILTKNGKTFCNEAYDSAPGYYGSLVGFLDAPLNSFIEKIRISPEMQP
jgi:WG containing repeat